MDSLLVGKSVMVKEIGQWGIMPDGFTWGRQYTIMWHDSLAILLCDDAGRVVLSSFDAVLLMPPMKMTFEPITGLASGQRLGYRAKREYI